MIRQKTRYIRGCFQNNNNKKKSLLVLFLGWTRSTWLGPERCFLVGAVLMMPWTGSFLLDPLGRWGVGLANEVYGDSCLPIDGGGGIRGIERRHCFFFGPAFFLSGSWFTVHNPCHISRSEGSLARYFFFFLEEWIFLICMTWWSGILFDCH